MHRKSKNIRLRYFQRIEEYQNILQRLAELTKNYIEQGAKTIIPKTMPIKG